MKKKLAIAALCVCISLATFVSAVAWSMQNVEVYWQHDTVALYLLGHEWEFDAFCDCSDCEAAR